jgi:hypothetical protein
MTKEELIQLISDDLTASGSIKLNLNTDEISRIIDVEKEMMHRDWRDTVELKYAVMNPQAFHTAEFKASRTIQLPSCVYGIDEFREIKDGGRLFGLNDPDLRLERVMASDLWLSPFSSDVITSRTISYSWFDLSRSFTLTDIQFRFNINTHRINVIGHDPIAPVLIRAYVAIDDADLYDDYYAQRWFIAKCKCQLHRVLKTFEYNTIGGVSITSMYGEQGQAELEKIQEYMKGQDTADWFLMFQ